MGLLDQFAGQAGHAGTEGALLSGAMGLLNSAGGLPGLLQKFKDSGLESQVASWLGNGENQPVSADQVKTALGEENVRQVAEHAGIAPEHAASGLAQMLPEMISKLTPNGVVPQGDLMQEGLSLLKGKLFG